MGRRCGYLALIAGIAGGAELVVVPEVEMTPPQVADALREAYDRGTLIGERIEDQNQRPKDENWAAFCRMSCR
jgi:6-phosphofructokinase 1